jgi:hypothetical protein
MTTVRIMDLRMLWKNINGNKKYHYRLGVVEAVGKFDLIISEENHYRKSVFSISKSSAQVVSKDNIKISELHHPEVGDLVFGITETDSLGKNVREVHGILIEVKKVPGQISYAKLRKGNEEIKVRYDILVTLENNKI